MVKPPIHSSLTQPQNPATCHDMDGPCNISQAKGTPALLLFDVCLDIGGGGKITIKSEICNGMGGPEKGLDGAEEEDPYGHLALDMMLISQLSWRHTHLESWTLSFPWGG